MGDPSQIVKHIPELMSRVYMDAVEASVNAMHQLLPQILDKHYSTKQTMDKNENDFFNAWPDLKEQKASVEQIAHIYRQLNPTKSKEDFIKEVGAIAMVQLGIQPKASSTAPVAQVIPPHRPPGVGGAPRAVGQPANSGNKFAELVSGWQSPDD